MVADCDGTHWRRWLGDTISILRSSNEWQLTVYKKAYTNRSICDFYLPNIRYLIRSLRGVDAGFEVRNEVVDTII